MGVVKEAERRLLESESTKNYLGIEGLPAFNERVPRLVFGDDHPALVEGRIATAQTVGGTGALRIFGETLNALGGSGGRRRIWISDPTWANHHQIFPAVGWTVETYPYFDAETHGQEGAFYVSTRYEIVELLVRELDAAADRVLPGGRALVGHAEADRALVLVGVALLDEPRRELAAALHGVELVGDLAVPVEPEPAQRLLDLLDGRRDLAARVGVLDPEQALAAGAPREEPVELEGVHAADVEEAGRARGHANANGHDG